jgi:anti-sigma regulatory factor (Ser/Thr protein kinase)
MMPQAQITLAVREPSQVADARRRAAEIAGRLSFDETMAGKLAIAVTEAATNLLKHGGGGSMLIRPLGDAGAGGIEVIALDGGPGIANVSESMRDGHSTVGSLGTGLGAILRQTSHFDIYSRKGGGTALRFEVWAHPPSGPVPLEVGAVCAAMPGETVAGDAWTAVRTGRRHVILVADGLGHGPDAAAASHAAAKAVKDNGRQEAVEMMAAIHQALRETRGAAGAIAVLHPGREAGTFCGIGNIAAMTSVNGKTHHLVSYNGILGHNMENLKEFDFPFPAQALLVLHSDGIAKSWKLENYPGLEARHPSLIAAVLYRDQAVERDDATIVVIRNNAGTHP